MIGKRVKINDYMLTYGKNVMYADVYGAFKYNKNGNRYVVYSYVDNIKKGTKLYYGSLFIRNSELVVMLSKNMEEDVIESFVNDVISNKNMDSYDIVSLDKIDSIQIIDDAICDFDVDINTLYNKCIPKVKDKKEDVKEKGHISFGYVFFALFFVVVGLFFFVNPEVIKGKDVMYVCDKSYDHESLPARIVEEVSLVFNSKGIVTSMDIRTDYVFSDSGYYAEYKDNGYFYQYMDKGDTYKFDDESYTYRVFSKVDTFNDYFLPTKMSELLNYYKDNSYSCKEESIE